MPGFQNKFSKNCGFYRTSVIPLLSIFGQLAVSTLLLQKYNHVVIIRGIQRQSYSPNLLVNITMNSNEGIFIGVRSVKVKIL